MRVLVMRARCKLLQYSCIVEKHCVVCAGRTITGVCCLCVSPSVVVLLIVRSILVKVGDAERELLSLSSLAYTGAAP